jgi:tRNA U34 2-thiouridine synthase MnmA/TrmU
LFFFIIFLIDSFQIENIAKVLSSVEYNKTGTNNSNISAEFDFNEEHTGNFDSVLQSIYQDKKVNIVQIDNKITNDFTGIIYFLI